MIRIHNFVRGARGLRAFWVCEEMGVPYEAVAVPYPQPAAYKAMHPLATVPFLEGEDGVAIHESTAIMLYLAQRHGPTPLLPAATDAALAKVLQWTIFGETAIGGGLNTLLAAKFAAPEADKANWSARMAEARMAEQIAYVGDSLGDAAFLVGDDLTLADISVSCGLGIWVGAFGGVLPQNLVAWRERLAERPAYQRARARSAG
jgi:glutathione S-transferase